MLKSYTLIVLGLFLSGTFSANTVPATGSCSVTIAAQNATCHGACNGMAIANPSGGTGPYTYSWSPTAGTGDTIKNICPGTYTVNVMDALGCTTSNTVTITEPAALTVIISANNSTCSCNGSLLGSANGGTSGYSYSWLPSGGSSASATGLCPGTYTLIVTDANGCVDSAGGIITSSAPPVSTILTHKNVTCTGLCNGKITVSTNGGSGTYTYSWSPGTSVSTVDSNLCAGNYTLTTVDAAGCSSILHDTIIAPGAAIATTMIAEANLKCNGQCRGKAMVTVTGGTSPFTYSWSPTAGNRDSATNLCAGTSTVTVTDKNGCMHVDSIILTEPAKLVLTPFQKNVTCNGGSDGLASVTATGGTKPFTTTWLPTLIPFGLKAGPEVCLVTDSNGCRAQNFFNITQPKLIVPVVAVKPASCSTCSDGRDSVTVTGGIAPYMYNWSPGGCSLPMCSGLTAGTYSCCITDSAGCQVCQSVDVGVLGINELGAPSMYIFPNPVGDQLFIQIPAEYNIQGLALFNMFGQELMEIKSFKATSLDVSMLKPGTYLLRLYAPEGNMHKLFIKR